MQTHLDVTSCSRTEKQERSIKMAYYVTISIAGTMEEEDRHETLASAREERDRLDEEAVAKGHEPGFWIILDEDGNEVE